MPEPDLPIHVHYRRIIPEETAEEEEEGDVIKFVNCPQCHLVRLTPGRFKEQRDSEDRWRCPRCETPAEFVELAQEMLDLGCLECHEEISQQPIFSEELHAVFCSKLCLRIHEERVKVGTRVVR